MIDYITKSLRGFLSEKSYYDEWEDLGKRLRLIGFQDRADQFLLNCYMINVLSIKPNHIKYYFCVSALIACTFRK